MKPTDIAKVLRDASLMGQEVTVCGWVRTARDSAAVALLGITHRPPISPQPVGLGK